MKGQRFILITLGIYITVGVIALLYLPSHSMDTASITDNVSVTTVGLAESSTNIDVIPKSTESNLTDTVENQSNSPAESKETPLFIDIKGTPIYESKYYNYTASHTRGNLFIRVAPGMTEKIIDRLAPGDTGIVIRLGIDWSYVHYEDLEGYISTQYLAFTEREPTSEEKADTH